MKRFKILHNTRYHFSDQVELLPHTFRLRPREGHELRIESSKLEITPAATLRWHRDVEGNSIAIASFKGRANSLTVASEVVIQKYDLNPHDFLVSEYAVNYPFTYEYEDVVSLAPYISKPDDFNDNLIRWTNDIWNSAEKIQTFALLNRINQRIFQTFNYVRREEEGVQRPEETIFSGAGSCRDFASLFMAVVQRLGFAARFVSGYIFCGPYPKQVQSTHAWAEVFIPGAGWKGFDPTFGKIVGAEHITTAVARRPHLVPPISGSYFGATGAVMNVEVWVTEAN